MAEKDKKLTDAENIQNEKKAAAQKIAEKKQIQLEQKEKNKKVLERARRIQAARKAHEAQKASEERKARMARRAEERKRIEEAKKREMENKSKMENKLPGDKVLIEKKPDEPEYVDLAVTARKYKTLLTNKYMGRKFWVNPSPYEIQSYIPGTIISIDVKEGKVVEEGAQLLILEAMKMQNKIEMPFTARIKKIYVKPGEKIPKDFIMIELEPLEK